MSNDKKTNGSKGTLTLDKPSMVVLARIEQGMRLGDGVPVKPSPVALQMSSSKNDKV